MKNRSVLFATLLLLTACQGAMVEQPKIEPMEASAFFDYFQSARPITEGAVPRSAVVEPEWFDTGMRDGELAVTVPLMITAALLERGQTQYNIFCSPCHGLSGEGDGVIVQRGFPAPPSFHSQALRAAPAGHFFEVITNGTGDMFPYGARVPPADRWAIIAHIRALQMNSE